MSSWGKGLASLLLLSVILFSCEDEDNLLGFKSPDENFKVVYKEFILPTSVYQGDSLITSSGYTPTNRLLVGSFDDETFGRGSATAYAQYFPVAFPLISDTAKFERITMTLVFDFYHFGSEFTTSQTYEIHELTDSIVNSQPYYTRSSTPFDIKPLGSVTRQINPSFFDQTLEENNADNVVENNTADSLVIDLSANLGLKLFQAVRSTDSVSVATYRNFFRWRKIFKGLAIIPIGTDKVIGIDPSHANTAITIFYREGTTKQVRFTLTPNNYGMASYSNITIERSGTPLSAVNGFYNEIEPADQRRYIHSGSGILTRVDLTPVYDYFDDIPIKSLNVAEFSIVSEEQRFAQKSFVLRALRPDNRFKAALTRGLNEAYDSVSYADPAFFSKHLVHPDSNPMADVVGDDGTIFQLAQKSNVGNATYKGFMTSFLQRELSLTDKDYLTHFGLVPAFPEFGKSLHGFYFHKDSVKLKVYYTTPNLQE